MKPFYLAASMLVIVLVFCLWNADTVTRKTEALEAYVSSAGDAADRGDWNEAKADIAVAHDYWDAQQTYFHIVIQHEALDDAESLFCQLSVYCDEQESSDFRAGTADLVSQLKLLSEFEKISIKNIL